MTQLIISRQLKFKTNSGKILDHHQTERTTKQSVKGEIISKWRRICPVLRLINLSYKFCYFLGFWEVRCSPVHHLLTCSFHTETIDVLVSNWAHYFDISTNFKIISSSSFISKYQSEWIETRFLRKSNLSKYEHILQSKSHTMSITEKGW